MFDPVAAVTAGGVANPRGRTVTAQIGEEHKGGSPLLWIETMGDANFHRLNPRQSKDPAANSAFVGSTEAVC